MGRRIQTVFAVGLSLLATYLGAADNAFFQASPQQPYHLSVGAVLFNQNGEVACHHFKGIFGHMDIYILMRESVEDGDSLLDTLQRGLMEEFGATAKPKAFIGCLSGPLPDPQVPMEKTTLYIACEVEQWDPAHRDPNDPEAFSEIEWLKPEELVALMKRQGALLQRVDADESEMIIRALPYIRS